MAKEKMTVQKWYGRSLPVPGFGDRGYRSFLVSSLGIVRSVLKEHMGKVIRVNFREVNTAHADFDRSEITINHNYLTGDIGEGFRKLNSEETIALILGIVVHEAAHFAYSPPTLLPGAAYIAEHTTAPYVDGVAKTLCNVIEDIYIEAEVERQTPTLFWMLEAVNDVFFPKEVEKATVEGAKEVVSPPESLEQAARVLNALLLAKTREALSVNPYVDGLFQMVRSATGAGLVQDRFALALKVYDALMCNILESDEGKGSTTIEEVAKKAEGLTASHESTEVPIYPWSDKAIAQSVEAQLKQLEDSVVRVDGRDSIVGEVVYVETPLPASDPVVADERYERLAEIGRQRASVNRPYGTDRNRGTNIRKLYRIATDQKIFSETVTMNGYKPMQVIILLDCSGSMYSLSYFGSGEMLIESATQACLGAAKGLADARCDVAVFGHTGDLTDMQEVTIYKAKEFNEPISVLPSRLGSLAYGGARMRENRDGYAIREVAKRFTSPSKRRLLIVISDGVPLAPNYRGWEAVRHTKEEVNAVRASGIDVISVSIKESANRVNDEIYGANNNVCNEDPNVIESIIRSLIVK